MANTDFHDIYVTLSTMFSIPTTTLEKILSFIVPHNVQITACHTIKTLLQPYFPLHRGTRKLSIKESIVSGN
jgi:hypothetical protein